MPREAEEYLTRCLATEVTLHGDRHVRTYQVRRVLDELRNPLIYYWIEPNPYEVIKTVDTVLARPVRTP